ncbi:hypothetical protein HanXRQr2_Chr06g0241511 [Helianthus annuus]|uniref:Uncharacterized protein n=1 Tax=Helianthus annuus TaxID=4232 RepID=A0A251UF62_HELAN|nr:hypothetical protein HanXRQr2_Chr06g0241511 [Helianthus annuus]
MALFLFRKYAATKLREAYVKAYSTACSRVPETSSWMSQGVITPIRNQMNTSTLY